LCVAVIDGLPSYSWRMITREKYNAIQIAESMTEEEWERVCQLFELLDEWDRMLGKEGEQDGHIGSTKKIGNKILT